MNEKKQTERGFTLVEVMIAMGIFVFGALAIFSLQINSIKTAALARKLTLATELAQFPIEGLKAAPFAKSFDAASSQSASPTTTTFETDQTPAFNSASSVYQAVALDWRDVFGNGNSTTTPPWKYFGKTDFVKGIRAAPVLMGKGRMVIRVHKYTPPGGSTYNDYADVRVIVWWCDNILATDANCALQVVGDVIDGNVRQKKGQHVVEAKSRFLNVQ